MADESNRRLASGLMPGFLVTGSLWGFAIGYFLADGASKSIGYLWYANPYQTYYGYTLKCLVIGPIVGLLVGVFVDMLIADPQKRKRLVEVCLALLVFVTFIYFFVVPFPFARE